MVEVYALSMSEDGKPKLMILYTSEREEIKNAVECVHTFVEVHHKPCLLCTRERDTFAISECS
eukprot:5968138-Amphidinium_carterae.2